MIGLEALRALVLATMATLGAPERVEPSPELADGIAQAVVADQGERLTGTAEGDAVLMAVWAYQESRFDQRWDGRRVAHLDCATGAGDGGKAHGPFQIQGAPMSLACAPADAARLWLALAHASVAACTSSNAPDDRLAALASGSCSKGRALTRWRLEQARELARKVKP